jgi:hypothetical protein
MTAAIEVRPYTDFWLHCYRADDFDGRGLVTPICAEVARWYGVDHVRHLIGDPVEHPERGEIHPGCVVAARTLIPSPRQIAAQVQPTTGAIRGSL